MCATIFLWVELKQEGSQIRRTLHAAFLFPAPSPSQNKEVFNQAVWVDWSQLEVGGAGGGVMLASPERRGEGADHLLCGPGQAEWRLTFEKRQGPGYPFSKPLPHPHGMKYTKSNSVLQ